MNGFVRWVKFSFVGMIGIGVQLSALFFLTRLGHFSYLIATGVAVECAVVHNFLWHQRFTWRDRGQTQLLQTLGRFLRFNAGNGAISLVGNVALMRLLVGQLHFRVMIANLVSIGTCALANFLVSDRWVFVASRIERGAKEPRARTGLPVSPAFSDLSTRTVVALVAHQQQGSLREWNIYEGGAGGQGQSETDLWDEEKWRERPQLVQWKNEQKDLSEFRCQVFNFKCDGGQQVQANGNADQA